MCTVAKMLSRLFETLAKRELIISWAVEKNLPHFSSNFESFFILNNLRLVINKTFAVIKFGGELQSLIIFKL